MAIAPIAVPSANGVRIEEMENSVSISADSRGVLDPARSAYAAPRMMIPIAAMNSGTGSVVVIALNAPGYDVQNTVSTKISHTWLASHTGPIEWCACSRIFSPRSPEPVNSCQNPAPKSAPPSTV